MSLQFHVIRLLVICGTVLSASAATLGVVTTAGANPAQIQAGVDNFRNTLGALNPNQPGSLGSGRREINWDGVPPAFRSPNDMPPDFFNVNSPRGAVFSTPGTGFQISGDDDPATGVNEARFGNINSLYPDQFQTFSPIRLFTSTGSNVMDVNFFVPGSNTPAVVTGFGAVFADVDIANLTKMEAFDRFGNLIDTGTAQVGSLSFFGLYVDSPDDPLIASVRLTLGNLNFGGTENVDTDLVVMDDFIYGEPVAAVPEPSSMLLLGSALFAGVVAARRKRS